MKFQLLVLSALFAGAAASYGFFKTFDDCYEQGPSLVEGTESCKGSSEENSGSGSHESSTGFTESSTGFTESSTGFTESSTLFSTASLGYTPSPGECVCITDEPSSTISVSSSFGSSSSAVPSSSFGSSSSALPSSSPSSLGTSTQSVITCPCQLIDLLYGLLPCLEGTPYYDIFLEFIISIQVEILVDQSLSYEEKLNACLGQLTVLLELNYEMMVILKVQPLPGFGYFCDLITWSQQYQMEVNITTVMFVADESGSCPLEQAMLNCSTCTADEISLIEEFWAEINITLTGDYTFEEMCVLFWQQFSVFIEMHVELKAKILSLPIPGFGVCGQFFDLCETYYMLYSLEFSIGGSVEVNAYLQAIQVAIDNCEDAALVVQLQQYYQTMCAEFDAEDDCNIRLDLIVNSTYSFLSGQSWNTEFLYAIRFNYTCEGVTTELCLYDLLFIAYFRYKFGFNCGLEPGKSSEESTSSSVSPSTEAPFLLNCSDVYGIELASNFDECNYTNYAVYSMRDAYNNSGWTTACKNSLLTVINNCQKQSDGPEVSWQTQLDKMVYYLTLNPANSDDYMNILFNVVVTLSDGRQWGRVHHLGLCTPYGDLCPTCMS